jgi:flagellar basal-body rod protein FlgB
MPIDGLFDRTVGVLTKVLDLRHRSQQVISSNLANIDTPGYTPSRLRFEKDLQQALDSNSQPTAPSHPKHFALGGGSLEQITGRVEHLANNNGLGDQNGVDLDQEMVTQAENQIYYEAATQMLNKKLGLLKYVVQSDR